MGMRSKDRIKALIAKDMLDIHNRYSEVKKSIEDSLQNVLDYIYELHAQIPESTSGPLITKTPKVPWKRGAQRIEAIPEEVVVDTISSDSIMTPFQVDKQETGEVKVGRSKREASKKAANMISKQQSLKLSTKLRRKSNCDKQNENATKKNPESRRKRKQSARSSSDEENTDVLMKQSRMEEAVPKLNITTKSMDFDTQNRPTTVEKNTFPEERVNATITLRSSTRKRSSNESQIMKSKQRSVNSDTTITRIVNDIEEPSIYEDAIGKPTPIMSSTMNFNSTMTIQKMLDAIVIVEPLSTIKVNETITIKKNCSDDSERDNRKHASPKENEFKLPSAGYPSKITSPLGNALQDEKMQQIKEAMANEEFDKLLTDDESSVELNKPQQNGKKLTNRIVYFSSSSCEDEVPCTPQKAIVRGVNTGTTTVQDIRNTFKSNALFSPYAKESVKKRVEAFEQARMNSPKPNVNADVPTRVTRTKTRAIAAAQAEALENAKVEKTVVQKLARNSLAKAKKISLAKQVKPMDDYKENKMQVTQKLQKQLKTTPLGKIKIQLPISVNRTAHTPVCGQYNTDHNMALSATRTNIITSIDSFLHGSKTASKRNSSEKTEEKKRKLNDDDAKRKKEEALKLQTEEKRRKREEKELKNKMAREAKEKQNMAKRQKAEREREEKARLAQQIQEKQREEMERKRQAQIQRVQIKEEKRKHEEQQRLQRLADQEEMERVLAEQRRREQEAEKRKEMEARVQHQTAVEAMRIRNQILAHQANIKHGNNKNENPTNYVLDSEPDDDESDDESRPKHAVPHWAQPQIRRTHLSIQRYIPQRAIFRFFDTRKCTPDLTQLFHGIDRSKLKRTSSAIWKTPPRYSMMDAV